MKSTRSAKKRGAPAKRAPAPAAKARAESKLRTAGKAARAAKPPAPVGDPAAAAAEAIATLKAMSSKATRDGMARFAIPSDKAFGVPVGAIRRLGKELGRNHELAEALWDSGWYEARLLAAFVAEPERLTAAQMDRWTRDFDNWAVCDTLCFHLFDRTPLALKMIAKWSGASGEFVKRTAYALLASVALHDRELDDAEISKLLPLVEREARDERNFVKKGVSWALRSVGHRSRGLHAEALELARRLAASDDAASRWIGKDAMRDLTRPTVQRKLR